jgi:hypothetical protein
MSDVGEVVQAWVVGGHVLPATAGDLATPEELSAFVSDSAPGDVLVVHDDGVVELLAGDEFAIAYEWIGE